MLRCLLLALLLAEPAAAQTTAPIYVDPQKDRKEEIACNLSYEQSVSAIQAGLRHNNIPVAYKADGKALRMYVTLTTIELGATKSNCATAYELSLYEPRMVFSTITNATHEAVIEYCFKNGIISGRIFDLQARLSEMLKLSLDACLSDFGRYTIK